MYFTKWLAPRFSPGTSSFYSYTSDIPETSTQKFIYVNNIAIATQVNSFEKLENTLNSDFYTGILLQNLQPNPNKTIATTFNLSNSQANRGLDLYICGCRISHQRVATYLGVKLARALTFRHHNESIAAKTRARKL